MTPLWASLYRSTVLLNLLVDSHWGYEFVGWLGRSLSEIGVPVSDVGHAYCGWVDVWSFAGYGFWYDNCIVAVGAVT